MPKVEKICGNCSAFTDYGLGGQGHCENDDEITYAKNKCHGPKNGGVFFISKTHP